MVMKKNMMGKNLRRSITRSLGRYIAIIAIIALGSGLFVGLLATKDDLLATAQHYTDKQNMYDLRLISGCGWGPEDVSAVAQSPYAAEAQGTTVLDIVAKLGKDTDAAVYQLHSIGNKINKVYLRQGRMPETPNECLADHNLSGEYQIGDTFALTRDNPDATGYYLKETTFTVVGFASSPLYMDISRGNTDLGNGSIRSIIYLPEEAFVNGIYTYIDVTIPGEFKNYTDSYDNAMLDTADLLTPLAQSLADNRYKALSMAAPTDSLSSTLYILDRNTNVGYAAVNNNSHIVSGVSRVFPAFFLLVASLICITTMTRMVEEERTQIGILKALGYSNLTIAKKYLLYAGSAAVLGCGAGVSVGSVVFPKILWSGYGIILTMTEDIRLVFNLPLCIAVTGVYTSVILAVTWYCCSKNLQQVSAELIRPKAPASGKKILLEHLFFWKRLSFLNKVMLRNIFRFRQRLLMMLIGVGGCTALLVTGFGLGDSIMDIVDRQFENITPYEMQLQFDAGQTDAQRQELSQSCREQNITLGFAHQSSVELQFENRVWNLYLIIGADPLDSFFDLHRDEKPLAMPKTGECLLSVGVCEALGIDEGDTVTIRSADMKTLTLRVSGIFDNHVYNYVITDADTASAQWGQAVPWQIAYVDLPEGSDPHLAAKSLSDTPGVISVMISQDLADQVGDILEGLGLIVATIVVCAALLALIVVYNLTNINITERVREIATIKVLGFYGSETASYVFKENLLLSVVGAAIGLPLGSLLLDFVMGQIKIDMVWMPGRIQPISLVWSVLITMAVTVAVDCLLFVRLNKINMAEALKSVE